MKQRELVNKLTSSNQALVGHHVNRVDVGAVGVGRPDAHNREAQAAGVCAPLHVAHVGRGVQPTALDVPAPAKWGRDNKGR